MQTILLIDDNEEYRNTAAAILSDEGYDIREASCPDEAYKLLMRERCDAIVSDIHMPFTLGEDFHHYPYSCEVGIRSIQELQGVFPDMPIIAVSAAVDLPKLREILKGIPVLQKPTSPTALRDVVRTALEFRGSVQ